jgi:hypothetical protein
MFEMSVKSVPGCLVLIAPSTIGVPVAAVPGFAPHCDVSDDPLDALVVADVEAELPLAALPPLAVLLELLELLLPHPAITAAATISATSKPARREG